MFEQFKELLTEEMSLNPDEITLDSSFVNDLGFNSLELADLVVLCEDNYGVKFNESELPQLLTVRDVVEYMEKQQS